MDCCHWDQSLLRSALCASRRLTPLLHLFGLTRTLQLEVGIAMCTTGQPAPTNHFLTKLQRLLMPPSMKQILFRRIFILLHGLRLAIMVKRADQRYLESIGKLRHCISPKKPCRVHYHFVGVIISEAAQYEPHNYYYYTYTQTNTFQAVLAANNQASFVLFLYKEGGIQWTTGNSHDGVNGTYFCLVHNRYLSSCFKFSNNLCWKGLRGQPATVGINAGDGINFETVTGTNTDAVINIASTTNIGIPGMWAFQGIDIYCDTTCFKWLGTTKLHFLCNNWPHCILKDDLMPRCNPRI